jgi:hypothetical protein
MVERRVSKEDLAVKEKRVNDLLKNIGLRVSYRYGYVAIDIMRNGNIMETLIAGLTKREAYDILDSIERVLALEKSESM